MAVLSLDLGTKLGRYIEGQPKAITYNLGKGDERFNKFHKILNYELYNLQSQGYIIDTIVHEGAAHQKGFAMPLYHGLVGVLKAFCGEYSIELIAIHAMTVKKSFTGKGRWTKEECEEINDMEGLGLPKSKMTKAPMIYEMNETGIEYDDDNSVDAYAVYDTYNKMKEKDSE